jgi:hypothetical protein
MVSGVQACWRRAPEAGLGREIGRNCLSRILEDFSFPTLKLAPQPVLRFPIRHLPKIGFPTLAELEGGLLQIL